MVPTNSIDAHDSPFDEEDDSPLAAASSSDPHDETTELEPAPPEGEALAPGLYLVATPIGNLEDITLRALRILKGVDRILAEDTRRTRILLDHYGIKRPCEPYHDFNKEKVEARYIGQLKDGAALALVSDAGTPGIADPAFNLVRAAIAAEVSVIPIPGATALITAVIASGLPTDRLLFEYFPPKKATQRKNKFMDLLARFGGENSHPPTIGFYVSPWQVKNVLEELAECFGKDLHVVLARELTKRYEEFQRGTAIALAEYYAKRTPKGEFVLLFHPQNKR